MKALNITDIQNDFCPGGALPVPHGDEIIPVVNALEDHFELVVATQDWHPEDHLSFARNHPGKKPGDVIMLGGLEQILWPDHCVQHSFGAEFKAGLRRDKIARIFQKGTDKFIDSYSGFFDNGHRKSTGLGDYLKKEGVDEIYFVGLATDYCVKYSALDAVRLGFKTFVILDGCRGINLKEGDLDRAVEEMKNAGIRILQSEEIKI
jgi:nicotinamidase/pyrazinamidase